MPDSEAEQWEDEWPPIEEIEALWREDEALALTLFGYGDTQKNGLPVTKYLKKGSKEERPAREAMARLLRSGRPLTLTQDFRNQLAAWFDGGAGRRRDDVRDTAIAEYVYRCIRDNDDEPEAQRKAASRFGLNYETIRDIWGHGKTRPGLRELLEQIDGPLKVV